MKVIILTVVAYFVTNFVLDLMMHFCSHLALLQLKKTGERVLVTGVSSIDKFPENLACDESVPLSSLEKLFTPRAWITFQER